MVNSYVRKIIWLPMLVLLLGLAACSPPNLVIAVDLDFQERFPPEALQEILTRLSRDVGVSSQEIKIVNVERVDWPDECLGVFQADRECRPEITPGYRVILEVKGNTYEFRSDLRGRLIQQVKIPESILPILPNTQLSQSADLVNCYKISFLGAVNNGDGTSSWRYFVENQACGQDSNNWVLELPDCAQLIDASPSPWETVYPNPGIQLKGIQWQTSSGFERGEFAVLLRGKLAVGDIHAGVKDKGINFERIAGPVCDPGLSDLSQTDHANTELSIVDEADFLKRLPSAPGPDIIKESDQVLAINCNGAAITIFGNNNRLTILGICSGLTVRGDHNRIYLEAPTNITDSGNENQIVALEVSSIETATDPSNSEAIRPETGIKQ